MLEIGTPIRLLHVNGDTTHGMVGMTGIVGKDWPDNSGYFNMMLDSNSQPAHRRWAILVKPDEVEALDA